MGRNGKQNFYVTGGAVRGDAPSYVERRADQELYQGLLEGRFCYVLTSRQMGKSSLMVRTAARLREDGVAVVVLDLTAIGQNLSAEQWYDGLLSKVGQQLQLEDELEKFWLTHPRLGPLQRWMNAITEVVLPRCSERLVIFVDEIDVVRSLSRTFSTDELFAGIREFYNRRTEEPGLERLTLCLLGVTTPSDLIEDTRTTPFNIGQRIELHDFTEAEAAPLAQGLGRDEKTADKLLKRILYWTNGHPYLTQLLCQKVAEDPGVSGRDGVDHVCEELYLSPRSRESDNNLLFVREQLLRSDVDRAGLLDLYTQVRCRKRVRDDEANPLVSILRLSGITRTEAGDLKVRNRIYDRAFDREWINKNMPDAELRRQRAAYRRGLLRATAIAALIIAAIGTLAAFAVQQRNLAKVEAARADSNYQQVSLNAAKAEEQRFEADQQRQIAEEKKAEAEQQQQIAEEQRNRAEEQQDRADHNLHQANLNAEEARNALVEAERQSQEAVSQRMIAEEQRNRAEEQVRINRQLLYVSHMKLAELAWEAVDVPRMQELLEKHWPKPDQEDLRGFEWYYLWRLCHGDQFTLRHADRVSSVAFSPDGKRLASGSADETVKLWDTATGQELFTLKGHTYGVFAVTFSPDGQRLASGSLDGTVKLWDVTTRQELLTLKGHAGSVLSVAFSSDGHRLASGSADSTVKLWDVATGRELLTLKGHSDRVLSIAFSPSANRLISGSRDRTVKLWDITTGQELLTLRGHSDMVLSVAFSPDGKMLASGSHDSTVKLWDVNKGQELLMLKGHSGHIRSVIFSPDGKRLASGSDDRTVKLWDVTKGRELLTIKGHAGNVSSVAFSPDGKRLASGNDDCTIKVWDVTLGQERLTFKEGVFEIALSPDWKRLVSRGLDQDVKLWDINTGQELLTLKRHMNTVFSVDFSPDGKRLASVSNDRTVKLWDITTGQELLTLKGHSSSVSSLAFSPDGKRLASGSDDRTVKLWDVTTGQELLTLKTHLARIRVVQVGFPSVVVAFSPDGKRLASGSDDGVVQLWDLISGQELLTIKGDTSKVYSVAFSPDGKRLASGSRDHTVKLWDVTTGQGLHTLKGHAALVSSVAFSPDGRTLASGSEDTTVKLWDVITGQEMLTLKGSAIGFSLVSFSPDGKRLALESLGGIVLWRAATVQEVLARSKQ